MSRYTTIHIDLPCREIVLRTSAVGHTDERIIEYKARSPIGRAIDALIDAVEPGGAR